MLSTSPVCAIYQLIVSIAELQKFVNGGILFMSGGWGIWTSFGMPTNKNR